MRKITLALGVAALIGAGGFYYAYEQAAQDYPAKILESILNTVLKDPASYTRLSSTALAGKDNSEMYVEIEYTAKNSMGGTVRSKALMILENGYMKWLEENQDKPNAPEELQQLKDKPFSARYAEIKLVKVDGKAIGAESKTGLPPFLATPETGWYPFTAPKFRRPFLP